MCNREVRCQDFGTYLWHGPYFPGALAARRNEKRIEAEVRNEATDPLNRRKNRIGAK
jgi:hypothetical protein